MSDFAVHVLFGVNTEGVSDEATIEADNLDLALARIREAAERVPSFHAITLLHVESLPAVMEGAVKVRLMTDDELTEARRLFRLERRTTCYCDDPKTCCAIHGTHVEPPNPHRNCVLR